MTKNSTLYFGETEEYAVIKFINSIDINERNYIYNTTLKTPFEKMIRCILKKYPIYLGNSTVKELEIAALSHLIDKISKYNPECVTKKETKTKAFSYCQSIIKNYFMDYSIKTYNERKISVNYDDYMDVCDEKMKIINNDNLDLKKDEDKLDTLVSNTINTIEIKINDNKSKLKRNDILVGNTIINVLRNWKTLFYEDLNSDLNAKNLQKNKILNYMQSCTGLTMKDIRKSIKRSFRQLYLIQKEICL